MHLVACIKQVPATEAKIRVAASGTDIERTGLSYVVNPYDEFAVEEALKIRERLGGDVTVVTVGPDRAAEALRTCLAMGADRAIHLRDEAFEGSDGFAIAAILAAGLKTIPYDLILCGKQAVDDDQGTVAIALAELLDLPHAAVVNKLEVDGAARTAVAHRQIEGAVEVLELPLPAVITCQKGLNEPRYPSLPGIMKAKQKPLQVLGLKELANLSPEILGPSGARLALESLSAPPERQKGWILEGTPEEAVRELVRLLREEVKVL